MSDIFIIPFGLIWGGFALLWEANEIVQLLIFDKDYSFAIGLVHILFGLPFVFVGVYLVIGRFVFKKRDKKNTLYVVTDKRILIIKDSPERVTPLYINQIDSINKSISGSGLGTIKFGIDSPFHRFYSNTGLEVPWLFHGGSAPAFYDIHDTEAVFDILNSIKSK